MACIVKVNIVKQFRWAWYKNIYIVLQAWWNSSVWPGHVPTALTPAIFSSWDSLYAHRSVACGITIQTTLVHILPLQIISIARANKTSIVKWVSSKPIHVTSREDVMRPNTDHFAMMLCNILMILFTACSNFGLCLLKHHLIAQQNRTSNVATCFTVTINSAPRDSVLRNADLRETMSKQPLYCGWCAYAWIPSFPLRCQFLMRQSQSWRSSSFDLLYSHITRSMPNGDNRLHQSIRGVFRQDPSPSEDHTSDSDDTFFYKGMYNIDKQVFTPTILQMVVRGGYARAEERQIQLTWDFQLHSCVSLIHKVSLDPQSL